jgi:hypothetical protein
MRLDRETRMTIPVLAQHGQSGRAIARMLGVDEKAVRYHLQRAAAGCEASLGPGRPWEPAPKSRGRALSARAPCRATRITIGAGLGPRSTRQLTTSA